MFSASTFTSHIYFMSKFASVVALSVFLFSPHISEAAFTVYSTPLPRIPTLSVLLPKSTPKPVQTYSPYIPTYTTPTYPTYTAPRILPIYIPRYTYTPTPTPLPFPTITPVPKKRALPAISKADRNAPDFIQNKTVAVIVDRLFSGVFGRKPEKVESEYWKIRARYDRATETKLRETMKYFLANKWTYGNL